MNKHSVGDTVYIDIYTEKRIYIYECKVTKVIPYNDGRDHFYDVERITQIEGDSKIIKEYWVNQHIEECLYSKKEDLIKFRLKDEESQLKSLNRSIAKVQRTLDELVKAQIEVQIKIDNLKHE